MSTEAVILLVVVVVLVLAVGAWFAVRQSRRRRLQQRFGPEYDRSVQATDDRRVAERELTEREKRHARYDLRPLSDEERARYAEQWTVVQEQFVDRPGEAVGAAEQLVHTMMRDRGYPGDNFEQRAADLSVEHASTVDSYRAGHDVRSRHEQAGVSTEELRQALMHYRAIFVSLAGLPNEAAGERPDPAVDRAYQAGRADAGARHHADGMKDRVEERVDGGAEDRVDGRLEGRMNGRVDGVADDRQVVDQPRRTNT